MGLGGKIMVALMNLGHSPVARWGLRFLELTPDAKVLDCGCGGGANIKKLLKLCPKGTVRGIDYSPVSVEKSKKGSTKPPLRGDAAMCCARAWRSCRLNRNSSMRSRPLKPSTSGLICRNAFARLERVLKSGGTFLICNESNGDTDKDEKWTEIIGGMTIYKGHRIESVSGAGGLFLMFRYTKKKSWLCVTARKR